MTKHKHDDAPVLPTPEQLRKHRYEQVRGDVGEQDTALKDTRTLRRVDGSVVDYLYACGHLSGREWLASVRLRKDAHLAGIDAKVTGTYEPVISGSKGNMPAARMDAEVRFRAAVRAVGKRLGSILVTIVIDDIPPVEWAADVFGYANRSAKSAGITALRLSLSALADHYGLEQSNG